MVILSHISHGFSIFTLQCDHSSLFSRFILFYSHFLCVMQGPIHLVIIHLVYNITNNLYTYLNNLGQMVLLNLKVCKIRREIKYFKSTLLQLIIFRALSALLHSNYRFNIECCNGIELIMIYL